MTRLRIMTTSTSVPPATPDDEALDRALDALVLGDAVERERLDPALWAAVEELYVLADLSDYRAGGEHRPARWPSDGAGDGVASEQELHAGGAPPAEALPAPIPIPFPAPFAAGRRFRWSRAAALLVAASLVAAVLGGPVLDALRDAHREPDPVMIQAVGSSSDPTASIVATEPIVWNGQAEATETAVPEMPFALVPTIPADPSAFGESMPTAIAFGVAEPTSPAGVSSTVTTRTLLAIPEVTRPLTVSNGETFGFGGMAAFGDTVYRLVATPEFIGVEAIDAATETVLWRLETGWRTAGIVAGVNGVVFASEDGTLVALDPETGKDRWAIPFTAPVAAMTLQDADLQEKILYVWDESGTMTAVLTETGKMFWDSPTGEPAGNQASGQDRLMPGVTPAIGADLVVMVDASGTLQAFDRTSGAIRWGLLGFDPVDTRLAINGDRLLVLSRSLPAGKLRDEVDGEDGTSPLYATGIDLNTGDVTWALGVSGPLLTPKASNETHFYVIADDVTEYPNGGAMAPQFVNVIPCCGESPAAGGEVGVNDGEAEQLGGRHVFGIDTASGDVIWSSSLQMGTFALLQTIYPQSGGLSAVTGDGQMVWFARDSGTVQESPTDFGASFFGVIPQHSDWGAYAIVLSDGTFVAIRRTQLPG